MSVLKCKNKNCKNEFTPYTTLQRLCVPCAILKAKSAVKKERTVKDNAEKKELKQKLKTVTDYRKELQILINKIARMIDYGHPCISCGVMAKKENGCHFKSVGANPSLRYNLLNIYLGCNKCNVELGGNVHGYDDGVIKNFGREFWEYIKFQIVLDFPILKMDIPELKEKISISRTIVKELESDLTVLSDSERIKKRIEINERLGIYETKYLF